MDVHNTLIDDLLWPTTEVTRTIASVVKGDLSQAMGLEVDGRPLKGEFLRSATIVNTMLEQMSAFTSEVTRVAREVGTEGKLGGQAVVPGVAGTWKDLTDNVNVMANKLTNQVRGIVKVVTAVATGDLSQRLTVESKGEVAALADTINSMTDTLGIFAEQVTSVAREVGVEGRLGGQAHVPGTSGTWKDLTANVNLLAANLVLPAARIEDVPDDREAIEPGDLSLLIIEDDPHYAKVLLNLARDRGFKRIVARNGADALVLARQHRPTALSLDVFLPDMLGWTVLSQLKRDPNIRHIPVQILTVEEERQYGLERGAFAFISKPLTTDGLESADMPESRQQMLETLHQSDEPLRGRKVLVVDDDIRNIFALNSLLERHGMQVASATNGEDAINLLDKADDPSLVLMDIMMPEMDGYETVRRIRGNPKLRCLLIIALTAKAMKGDREKCLEAGASDYVAKPVDTDQLLSLVRMCLHR